MFGGKYLKKLCTDNPRFAAYCRADATLRRIEAEWEKEREAAEK